MTRWWTLLMSSGCVGYAQMGVGAAIDGQTPAEPEGMVVASAAMAPDVEGLHTGLGVQARSRRGQAGLDAAVGPELCHMVGEEGWLVSLCGGASVLNVGFRDQQVALGAVSPQVSALLMHREDQVFGLMFGVYGGYDVRVTGQGGSPWGGVMVGYGPAATPR